MRHIIALALLLVSNLGLALEYRVHLTYPPGTAKPKTFDYDTKKHPKSRLVELINSKFRCATEAVPTGKAFTVRVVCNQNQKQSFDASALCAEGVKINPKDPVLTLSETPPKGERRPSWEHTISIECEPGKPSLADDLIKKAGIR